MGIIVDLATDSCSGTVSQITSTVKNTLPHLSLSHHWFREGHEEQLQNDQTASFTKQPDDNKQHQQLLNQVDLSNQSERLHLRNEPYHVILLVKKEFTISPIPSVKTIVSDDYVDLLFKAKTYLDESPGFGCEVQVITSAVIKKFWEAACLHMFSPVTTWSVRGVPVEDQPLTVKEPVAVARIENSIREYLKTVGDPGLVSIWRSDVIPNDQFNAGRWVLLLFKRLCCHKKKKTQHDI